MSVCMCVCVCVYVCVNVPSRSSTILCKALGKPRAGLRPVGRNFDAIGPRAYGGPALIWIRAIFFKIK